MDFGCAESPYRSCLPAETVVGVDVPQSGHDHAEGRIDVFYDGRHLPFADNSFDNILSSEVFEHIFNLPEILKELNRVLAPGGRLVLTVPFVWEEHETPYDFGRYTVFGLRHLLEEAGFTLVHEHKTTGTLATLCQLLNTYICRSLLPGSTLSRLFLSVLLCCPVNLAGVLLPLVFPASDSLYLTTIAVAEKRKRA
jgi:SAM-dependent methyltransferase